MDAFHQPEINVHRYNGNRESISEIIFRILEKIFNPATKSVPLAQVSRNLDPWEMRLSKF
jgi:hypothetical protein